MRQEDAHKGKGKRNPFPDLSRVLKGVYAFLQGAGENRCGQGQKKEEDVPEDPGIFWREDPFLPYLRGPPPSSAIPKFLEVHSPPCPVPLPEKICWFFRFSKKK